MPSLLFLATLGAIVAASSSTAEAGLDCPSGTLPAPVFLDVTRAPRFFYQGHVRYTGAISAADCRSRALSRQCSGSPSDFYVFAKDGFRDASKVFLGNCAFGASCIGLSAGKAAATVGNLPPAQVFCARRAVGPTDSVSCPMDALPRSMSIDATMVGEMARTRAVVVVEAAGAMGCRHLAQVESCSGQKLSFYIFSRRGFTDSSGQVLGNCALAKSCLRMSKGSSRVVLGNVDSDWCPRKVALRVA